MVKKKGSALLMVFTNIDSEHDFEFNKWYVEEHLPERLSAPGFLDAALYQATKGSPRYLAIYELESLATMQTPEYLHMSQNPTEWTKRIGPSGAGRGPGHRGLLAKPGRTRLRSPPLLRSAR